MSNIKCNTPYALDNCKKLTKYQGSNSSYETNQWKDPPNQTFPKSRKEVGEQKRLSVQICQDPSHLNNIRDFRLKASATSTPLRTNKMKGNPFLQYFNFNNLISLIEIILHQFEVIYNNNNPVLTLYYHHSQLST